MIEDTILVLGGAGYIGSHTAFLLAQHGYRVIIVDKFIHNQPFDHEWATVIRGDYGDRDILGRIFAAHRVSVVMHFAGFMSVGESVNKPVLYYENNVAKTITLLRVMQEYAVDTIIFSSSAAIYGIPQQTPITEDHPKIPINPYGRTKLITEELLCDCAHAYDLRYVALRYFNAAGALPKDGLGEYHHPETHLIPLALQATLNNEFFSIFGTNYPTPDGTCIRDYIHVADIAQAHLNAFLYLQEGGTSESFNLGTGTGYSVREILSTIQKITTITPRIMYKPERKGDPAILVADATKAKNILHWQPQYSDLDTIIKSAYKSMQQVQHRQRQETSALVV